jgi:glycosyltransferase involved in cell wall biosynthesis
MKLSALICTKNEEDFIGLCLEHLIPYVDEIILVDNGSTDRTKEIASQYDTVKMFDYPATNNMAEVRNFSLSKATGDWFLQVDADEIYPASEMRKIREFIETAEEKGYISARVHYKNMAWRS